MTVISAVIGKDIMAISTDSYKTKYIKSSDIYEVVEFKRPKILPVRKFHCAISFWGLVDYGGWSLEKFLKYLVRISPDNLSLQEFAQYIADGLRTEIDRIIPGNKRTKGFGLHVTGFEQYKNMMIPELFLISNFDGIEYKKIKDNINCERHLYPIASRELNVNASNYTEERNVILEYFQRGLIFYFNNGDPELFTPIARGYYESILRFRHRIRSVSLNIENYRHMARGPVESIKNIQKYFAPPGKRVVGGKIHDLIITSRGEFDSNSGVLI